MKSFKRISMIAALAYIVIVPLSLLNSPNSETEGVSVSSNESGHDIDGTVLFPRGGEVHIFGYHGRLVVGRAHFTATSGQTYSSSEVLGRIQRGEIPHDPIEWHVNWLALILCYLPIWLSVACFMWLFSGSKRQSSNEQKSEQVADGDAEEAV